MKYAWIDAHREEFELGEMCEALVVSSSGYRAWKRGGSPKRKRLTDEQMLALIRGHRPGIEERLRLCAYGSRTA